MQICGYTLAFFFLEPHRGIYKYFLLFMLHLLQLQLVTQYFSLVKYDKNDQSYDQYQHAQCAQEHG
jgi:hypothetical protein